LVITVTGRRIAGRLKFLLVIECHELHLAVGSHLDRAVGEHADRRIQYAAAERVAVRCNVGSTTGEPQAQRRAGAHLGHPRGLVEQCTDVDRLSLDCADLLSAAFSPGFPRNVTDCVGHWQPAAPDE
jgi:hypothetical protein